LKLRSHYKVGKEGIVSLWIRHQQTDGPVNRWGKGDGWKDQWGCSKLRQSNDKLLNMHCVCHRLALACTDSCQELKFIKEVENVLQQLWYYFHNSPKKTACFLKFQIQVKKVNLSHTLAKQISSFLSRSGSF